VFQRNLSVSLSFCFAQLYNCRYLVSVTKQVEMFLCFHRGSNSKPPDLRFSHSQTVRCSAASPSSCPTWQSSSTSACVASQTTRLPFRPRCLRLAPLCFLSRGLHKRKQTLPYRRHATEVFPITWSVCQFLARTTWKMLKIQRNCRKSWANSKKCASACSPFMIAGVRFAAFTCFKNHVQWSGTIVRPAALCPDRK